MNNKVRFWVAGLAVATLGVVLAKIVSPRFNDQPGWQFGLFAAGVLIALIGLGLIMSAARKPK